MAPVIRGESSNVWRLSCPTPTSDRTEITIGELSEWRGIQPNEEAIVVSGRNKNLPMVDVEQLLNGPFNVEYPRLEEPPLRFTFASAVKAVVLLLNYKAPLLHIEHNPTISLESPWVGGELIRELTNIETRRPDLIPEPPQYGGRVCSATSFDHRCWLGAILQMLYEKGHISSYGNKGGTFWACL